MRTSKGGGEAEVTSLEQPRAEQLNGDRQRAATYYFRKRTVDKQPEREWCDLTAYSDGAAAQIPAEEEALVGERTAAHPRCTMCTPLPYGEGAVEW